MAITAKMVQNLRGRTGAGMMDCKKALTASKGDMDKAIKILREKGLSEAAKKAGKTAAEGLVKIKIDNNKASIVEVNSETDFVAKNDGFIDFTNSVLNLIFETEVNTVEELNEKELNGNKFKDELSNYIAKIGENIKVRRFKTLKSNDNEVFCNYIHAGGSIGVLAKFKLSDSSKKDEESFSNLMKDICLQIAASDPKYIAPENVSEEDIKNEKEIYSAQMKNAGKPEKIIDKIVEGKMRKYYEGVCLIEQIFVKDSDKKVKKVISEVAKSLDIEISVSEFVRYKVGEGIEVVKECFADEIRKQVEAAKK